MSYSKNSYYDIGDRSLLFKKLSMFLKENYKPTLEVSDEYTLDLAKSIYGYLQEYYPKRVSLYQSVGDIYLNGLAIDRDKYTGELIYDNAIFNSDYGKIGYGAMVHPVIGGIDSNKSINFAEPQELIYDIDESHAKPFRETQYLLDVNLQVSLLSDKPNDWDSDVTLFEPAFHKYYEKVVDESGEEHYNHIVGDNPPLFISDYFYKADEQISDVDGHSIQLTPINKESIKLSKLNEFNINSWIINETIIQFIDSDTVISESSSDTDVLYLQQLAENLNYTPMVYADWDSNFTNVCIDIQSEMRKTNPKIIVNGFGDLYVEKYLRSQNEVRIAGV